MLKKYPFYFVVTVIFLAVAFSSQVSAREASRISKINVAHDPQVSIKPSGKFTFIKKAPSLPDSPDVDQVKLEVSIKKAIVTSLTEKRFTFELNDPAGTLLDFLVGFSATLDGATSIPFTSLTSVNENPWLGSLYKGGTEDFRKAVLVVDIFDMHTTKLIWRGMVESSLLFDPDLTDEERKKRTEDMVRRVLEPFPPPGN